MSRAEFLKQLKELEGELEGNPGAQGVFMEAHLLLSMC